MTTWYVMDADDSGVVVKVSGGVISSVPVSDANSDYQEYLAWLAEGNTPEPWPPAE